jgi:hypothetical protein
VKKLLGILFVMALVATPAFALDYTYDGGGTDTLDGGGATYGNIWVKDDTSGNPSTLTVENVVTETGHNSYVTPFNGSTMIINSGTFDGYVGAPYYYTFNGMDGAYDASLVINGGDFNNRVKADDGVLDITINDGVFSNDYDSGSGTYLQGTTMTINGGTFNPGVSSEYRIVGFKNLEITGGTFNDKVQVRSGKQLRITGGDFDYRLYFIKNVWTSYANEATDASWVIDGDFTDMQKFGAYSYLGNIHIAGGQWDTTGSMTWFDEMRSEDSNYHFYGTGFSATLLNTDTAWDGGTNYYYQVSGTLADGNAFNAFGTFWDRDNSGNTANFYFHDASDIPEPTTMALLGLGALGLVGARRRS